MAIANKNTDGWFHKGRGDVSAKLAKSDSEVLSQESEIMQSGMSPTGSGASVQNSGAKPLYATGDSPMNYGRGDGRGYSA